MNTCFNATVLQQMGMPPVDITRDEYVEAFQGGADTRGLKRKWDSAGYILPRSYSRIMKAGPTPWKSPTPQSMRVAMSAFLWSVTYFTQYLESPVIQLDAAWRTRLVVPFSMIYNLLSGSFHVIIGVSKWAALGLSVDQIAEGLFSITSSVAEIFVHEREVVWQLAHSSHKL